jgi:hypothetical protein
MPVKFLRVIDYVVDYVDLLYPSFLPEALPSNKKTPLSVKEAGVLTSCMYPSRSEKVKGPIELIAESRKEK